LRVERRAPVRRQTREIRRSGRILLQKFISDADEEAKGDAPSERGVGDDEVGEAAGAGVGRVLGGCGGDVVDEVLAVGEGELFGLVVLNFGKNERG